MAIDRIFLGQKVARYREQLLVGMSDVSQMTGIAVDRLRAIESGQVEPTGDEVLILADYFNCDFRFFISNERVAPFDQTEELYRAHPGEFTAVDRRAIQEFLYLCETEAGLRADLGRRDRPFWFVPQGTHFKSQGEQAALELRRHLGLSAADVPVNVYALFRQCGVHVFRRKLQNSGISGLFVKHPVAASCALVNFSEDVYRQRFSAAHEMGHAVLDGEKNATSVTYAHQDRNDLVEIRANRFASCFLMPPASLRDLPTPAQWKEPEIIRWAKHFRVSCHALSVALLEAHLIDQNAFSRLKEARVPGQAKSDPELPAEMNGSQQARKSYLLERGLSDDYVGLCFDALHAGVITVGRLAEAFLCSIHELGELAELYGRSLHGH